MKRFKEKLKAIYHIICDKEYAVFTGTSINKKVVSCCAIISDNASKAFVESAIGVLNENI